MSTTTTARPTPAMMGRRGGAVLADDEEAPAPVPAPYFRTALDEARKFGSYFIDTSDTVLDVMACAEAMSWTLESFYTVPRLLFHGDEPQCGKTEAESMVLRLSRNPWTVNQQTTRDSVRSKFDVPDPSMRPTIGIQDVSMIFGLSGRQGAGHPVNVNLREGYKTGEKTSISRNGSAVDIPLFCFAVMAGLKNAVPADIRTRCICIRMRAGHPRMQYVGVEHDPMADKLGLALGSWVRQYADDLKTFRARGIHPKLTGRLRECWEPIFAIAHTAGGTWPRRILAAFLDLAIDQAEMPPLTPEQTILRDMQRAAHVIGGDRVGGIALIEEMRRFGEPLYVPLSNIALSMFMSEAMYPIEPYQFRLPGGKPVRGYDVASIERMAAERLPAPRDEAEEEEPDLLSEMGTIFDVPDNEDFDGNESQPSQPSQLAPCVTA
jgi:Protein of unknown function (DUF3631)